MFIRTKVRTWVLKKEVWLYNKMLYRCITLFVLFVLPLCYCSCRAARCSEYWHRLLYVWYNFVYWAGLAGQVSDVVLTCLCVAKLFSPQAVRYAAQSTGIECYTVV